MQLPESPYYTERQYRSYRDRFTIIWMVTRACNFDCDYCVQPENVGDPFDVDEFIARLGTFPQPVRLLITGGEPLLLPWTIELCKKVGAMGGTIELQTNFSVNAREFIDQTSPEYIDIIETSYHPAARRKHGGFEALEKFTHDFLYAREKGFNITTWLIDDPRISPDTFLKECEFLYSCGIKPARKRYNGEECGMHIGDSIYVPRKRCLAGHRGVCMWENFDITVCDHDRTILGNLFTGFQLRDVPTVCAKKFCGCLGREWLVDTYHDEYYNRDFGGTQ